MAFDFNNIPFKKKESDPFRYSPPYTPGTSNSSPQDSLGTGPVSKPFGTGRSTGFQDVPTQRPNHIPIQKPVFIDAPNVYEPPRTSHVDIPWRIIIPVVLAIVILAFLYVNREAIASFLSQLISWIIVIAVFAIIFKLILFPGGRNRRR